MNQEIKVGDLVETCSLLPVVMKLEKQERDTEVEVRMLHVDEYATDNYACCLVQACGLRKINAEFAKMLIVIGMPRIGEIYQSIEEEGEAFYVQYDLRIAREYNEIVRPK